MKEWKALNDVDSTSWEMAADCNVWDCTRLQLKCVNNLCSQNLLRDDGIIYRKYDANFLQFCARKRPTAVNMFQYRGLTKNDMIKKCRRYTFRPWAIPIMKGSSSECWLHTREDLKGYLLLAYLGYLVGKGIALCLLFNFRWNAVWRVSLEYWYHVKWYFTKERKFSCLRFYSTWW